MKNSLIFLATGFEEIEALATVDILRRAGMEVTIVSIYKDRMVTGAHGITVAADVVLDGADTSNADWLIFPGGLPGAQHLADCSQLMDILKSHVNAGGRAAAICASPGLVLAPNGIVAGKSATAYPGFEQALTAGGATVSGKRVSVDKNIITANGPSSTTAFALAIAAATVGQAKADEVAEGLLVNFSEK